jgi:hypothetical protein
MHIKLYKIKSLLDIPHPNNIEEGDTRYGFTEKKPTVGESFLITSLTNWFCTSVVTEIIDENTFRTENSIYKMEVKDETNRKNR